MSSVRIPTLARSAAVLACGVVVGSAALLGAAGTAGAAPAPKVPFPAAGASTAPLTGEALPAAIDPKSQVGYGLKRGQQLDRVGTDSDNANAILSVGIPPEGTDSVVSGAGTGLVLQLDGNLVEYETSTDKVLFNTNTTTGSRLVYQEDGNVVLYDTNNVPLFQTGTAGDTRGDAFVAYGNGQLVIQPSDKGPFVAVVGTPVTPAPGVVDAAALAPSENYYLTVQDDGNVVAYREDPETEQPVAFWQTGTQGNGRVRLAAQSDGNLVVYSATTGRALWQTGTSQPGSAYFQLDMQDDGNIVLYRTDGEQRLDAVWASNTVQAPPVNPSGVGK